MQLRTIIVFLGIVCICTGAISLYSGIRTNNDSNNDVNLKDELTKNIINNSVMTQNITGIINIAIGALCIIASFFPTNL